MNKQQLANKIWESANRKRSKIEAKESRLSEIPAECEEILDELSEEEKSKDYVNEDGTAFVAKQVIKKVKELKKGGDSELFEKLQNTKKSILEKMFPTSKSKEM